MVVRIDKPSDVPEELRCTQEQLDALPQHVKDAIAALPPDMRPIPRKPAPPPAAKPPHPAVAALPPVAPEHRAMLPDHIQAAMSRHQAGAPAAPAAAPTPHTAIAMGVPMPGEDVPPQTAHPPMVPAPETAESALSVVQPNAGVHVSGPGGTAQVLNEHPVAPGLPRP